VNYTETLRHVSASVYNFVRRPDWPEQQWLGMNMEGYLVDHDANTGNRTPHQLTEEEIQATDWQQVA
jgi:hypothetical protein